jgi:hypothetical protein
MMVRLAIAVECSAQIAMTTLHSAFETMGLLPNHDLRRLIFIDAPVVQILLILK